MRNRPNEQTVCDRRILKAFYTQYVAVLLIILVFCVGAFQRASAHASSAQPPTRLIVERPPIGRLELEVAFDSAGSLARNPVELEAVADVIKAHDVRAMVTLPSLTVDEHLDLRDVEVGLARLDALRGYFSALGIAESDVVLVIGGPEGRFGKVTVTFEEVPHDNLPL